jgi:hypothetical protein
LLKNLNSQRALVNISIDGQDVVDGGLVVNANSEIELERYVKSNNLKCGNRFKFIERTGNIEKHRGIKVDDGLIRVEFKYEKRIPTINWVDEINRWKMASPTPGYNPNTPMWNSTPAIGGWGGTTLTNTTSVLRGQSYGATVACDSSPTPQLMNVATNDVGITAPGSISSQEFQTVSSFVTENETYVMVLKLLGETVSGQQVQQPVTVKSKPECKTCGRLNKATSRFCSECGTSLEIV